MNALLRFTVENFRSIAQRKSIIFTSDSIKDEPQNNVCEVNGISYLRTTAIYGANSSGKSNLIKAMSYMSSIIVGSVKINENEDLLYLPFQLNKKNLSSPTLYETDIVVDGVRYRYGFSNQKKRICEEWLSLIDKNGKEKPLFIRNLDGIGVNEKFFSEGMGLEGRTNDNRLFISLVGQLGGKISNSIINFFDSTMNTISGLYTDKLSTFTKIMLNENLPGCDDVKAFFSRTQLGFADIITETHEFDINELPNAMPREMKEDIARKFTGKKLIDVFSIHGIYNENGERIDTSTFAFEQMESDGTQKLFDLAGPIFDTILSGAILIVDELDAKMHPLISQELVSLFNDPVRNSKGAQLIFTTHDTNLLSSNLLRRDQIWFTEKDDMERTDIYSMRQIVLPDGSKPRGDGNIERNYIKGRYGAIPYIQSEIN